MFLLLEYWKERVYESLCKIPFVYLCDISLVKNGRKVNWWNNSHIFLHLDSWSSSRLVPDCRQFPVNSVTRSSIQSPFIPVRRETRVGAIHVTGMHAHPFHVVLCIAWPRPARLIIRRTIVPWIMDRCSPLPVPYSHFHESRTFRILRSSLVSSAIPTIPPPPPPQRNPFFARSLISTVSNRFFLLYFIVSEHRLYGLFLFFFNPFFFFSMDSFYFYFS